MLTIEDGTRVPGADSYATLAELAVRAAEYGGTLPDGAAVREVLLRRAAEAMNALRWRGTRASATQALAWPRRNVPGVGDASIPLAIKAAQCALAIELHADDLAPPESRKGAVVRERVDVLEVEYAEVAPPSPRQRASVVLLEPYVEPGRVQAVRA